MGKVVIERDGGMSLEAKSLEEGLRERVDPGFCLVDNRQLPVPFSQPRVPTSDARIALISSGGFHRREDPPFDTEDPLGDPSYRVIPRGSTREDLGIAHTHYDHSYVDADLNCALPLEHIETLVERGAIGESAPRHLSFMGYCLRTAELAEENAREAGELLAADAVDAAILAPT